MIQLAVNIKLSIPKRFSTFVSVYFYVKWTSASFLTSAPSWMRIENAICDIPHLISCRLLGIAGLPCFGKSALECLRIQPFIIIESVSLECLTHAGPQTRTRRRSTLSSFHSSSPMIERSPATPDASVPCQTGKPERRLRHPLNIRRTGEPVQNVAREEPIK